MVPDRSLDEEEGAVGLVREAGRSDLVAPHAGAVLAPRRAAEAPAGNPGMTFAMVLGSIMLLLAVAIAWRASKNPAEGTFEGMFKNMSDVFYDKMGSKKHVTEEIRKQRREIDAATRGLPAAAPEEGTGG